MNKSSLKLLTLLAVSGLISANQGHRIHHHNSTDADLVKINDDADQIERYELLMAMSYPDAIEQNWDLLEGAIKEEVNQRIEIASNKLKNKFHRYKELMERQIVRGVVASEAFDSANITVTNLDTPCDMKCV
jgi:hypothetical protein